MIWILWVHGIVHRQVCWDDDDAPCCCNTGSSESPVQNPGALVTQKVLKRREPDRAYAHMDPSHAHTHTRLLVTSHH